MNSTISGASADVRVVESWLVRVVAGFSCFRLTTVSTCAPRWPRRGSPRWTSVSILTGRLFFSVIAEMRQRYGSKCEQSRCYTGHEVLQRHYVSRVEAICGRVYNRARIIV